MRKGLLNAMRDRPISIGGGAVVQAFSPSSLADLEFFADFGGPYWQTSARATPATALNDPIGAWDDSSGNSNHATAASDAARGQLDTYSFGASYPTSFCNGFGTQFDVPAGVSFSRRDFTLFMSFVYIGNGGWGGGFFTTQGSTLSGVIFLNEDGKLLIGAEGEPDALDTGVTLTPGKWYTLIMRSTGTGYNVRLTVDGVTNTYTKAVAMVAGTCTGGYLATRVDGSVLKTPINLLSAGIYSRGNLSDGDCVLLEDYLTTPTFVGPLPIDRPLIAFMGNSFTYGLIVGRTSSWGYDVLNGLSSGLYTRSVRLAVAGADYDYHTGSRFDTWMGDFYRAGRSKNVLLVWEDTNQLALGGGSQADTETKREAYCLNAKNEGWLVIVIDCIDRQNAGLRAGFAADRTATNATLAADFNVATSNTRAFTAGAGGTYANVLVKASANAFWADATDTGHFESDKIHPNQAADYQSLADDVIDALAELGVT